MAPGVGEDGRRWGVCESPVKLRKASGRLLSARCWRRRCVGCSEVMALSDRAYIQGGLLAQMVAGQPVVMMTATEGSQARSFEASSKALSRVLESLGDWRRSEGLSRTYPYVVVPESHRGGVVHWHCLLCGFRYELQTKSRDGRVWPGHPKTAGGLRLTKRRLEGLYARQGFGTGFTGLRAVAAEWDGTDGQLEAVGRYLAKYLTKSGPELEVPKGFPLLRHSQQGAAWWPGWDLERLRHGQVPEGPVDARVRALFRAQVSMVMSGMIEPGSLVS